MSDRMHPDDIRAIAVATANLVDGKIGEIKALVHQSLDAGHAAITRASQVEEKLEDHERRLKLLERVFEDDFPRRDTGT